MKRLDLLKFAASLPVIGVLARVPASTVQETEEEVTDFWRAVGFSDNGKFISTVWERGWPTARELADVAKNGLDRFEVFRLDKIIYQAPTVAGKIPVGWDSLQHAGFISR